MPLTIVFVILIALGLALLLSEICKHYLRVPRVLGQIAAGLILGLPAIKQLLFSQESLDVLALLADLGMVMMFFFVGLEINLFEFRKRFRESAFISVFNTLLPLVAGFLLMKILGFGTMTSVIVGISLAVSAQSISVDMLEELKMLKTKIGGLIITAGAVDDVMELVLVSGILTLIHAAILQIGLAQLLANALAFIAILLLFRYALIPKILKPFEDEHTATSTFSGALIISLLLATISDLLGLGLMVGAISAGILMRQTLLSSKTHKAWEEREISRAVHILAFGFLVPLFSVWIGLSTNITSALQNTALTLALIAIAFIGTIGGTVLGVIASGGTAKEGLIVGWGVNPKGDVELVIASLALRSGIITQAIFSSIIVMAMVTTLVSPIVFRKLLERQKTGRLKGKYL